jgi:uncharacterized membrane protein
MIYWGITKLSGLLELPIPGMGLVILLIGITLIGWLGSSYLTRPFLDFFNDQIEKTPGIKFIYTSVKEMLEAFVGDKKKFTEAVLVEFDPKGISRLGFVTSKNLVSLNEEGSSAVYFPDSYNFSGRLFIVKNELIKPVKGNSSSLMKFVVSGGVTDI